MQIPRYQDTMATSEDTQDTVKGSEDTQVDTLVEPEDNTDRGEEKKDK